MNHSKQDKAGQQDGHGLLHIPLDLLRMFFGPLTRRNLISWGIFVTCILTFLWGGFEQFTIPSGSMEPTLHGDPHFFKGDRVVVNKFVYGLRFPFNGARIPLWGKRIDYAKRRFWRGAEPQRWDIVVFRSVNKEAEHGVLIKRVVGLPGERVHIAGGKVHIDGVPLDLPEAMPSVEYMTYTEQSAKNVKERLVVLGLPSDDETVRRYVRENRHQGDYGVKEADEFAVVPPGYYFVLGDNTLHSGDGRYFGWVPNENILGRAACVWWPFPRMHDFTGFSSTWWGRMLLYGIPLLIVCYEILNLLFLTSWRVEESTPSGLLRKGERVCVHLAAFGVRIPFTARRVGAKSSPELGDLLLYHVSGEDQLRMGHVVKGVSKKVAGKQANQYAVAALDESGSQNDSVSAEDIVGTVTRVWWPLWRMRNVNQPEQGDTE